MRQNSGNALWFILLAIFLLGGLTVLLSRTGSNTEETGSTERASIYASEILNYAASVATAVDALRARGCSENQISFYHPDHTVDYSNPNAPTDGSCDVFDVRGGGVPFKAKKDEWRSELVTSYKYWQAYGRQCIYGVGTGTTTCQQPNVDLIFHAGTLKKEICLAINQRLGIPSISGEPPSDMIMGTRFQGTYYSTTSSNDDILGDINTPNAVGIQNRKAFCMLHTGVNAYTFNQVLIAR